MDTLKKRIYKGYLYLRSHSFFIQTIGSFIVLSIVFTNLTGVANLVRTSPLLFISGGYQFLLNINMILMILFFPFYPLFYWFSKRFQFLSKYTSLERLVFTIIFNLSTYILIGYFSGMLGIPITRFYFYINVIIIYSIQLIAYITISLKSSTSLINEKYQVLSKEELTIEKFSILNSIKEKAILNNLLLVIFVLLICIFDIFRVDTVVGTDPWYHMTLIKIITEINYIPYDGYLGAMGLHIFSSIIYFFSGVEIILIPKFFVFYTFPISAIISYCIFKRVFKNKNLVVLGVFLLEFTSIGFSIMMYQFWPSSISFLMGLTLFLLVFVRFKYFIREEKENSRLITSNQTLFDYLFMIMIFLASIFTHSLITVILLGSYLFFMFIFYLKNHRVGQDFFILLGLTILFVIFNLLNIGSGHFNIFTELRATPWTYILVGAIGGVILFAIIVWKLKESVTLHHGSFGDVIRGKKYSYYKQFEDKFFLPLTLIVSGISIILYLVMNFFFWNFRLVTILTSLETTIILIFSIWGLILFQKKPQGKIFFIWAVALGLLFMIGFVFDILIGVLKLWSRIFYLSSPVVMIGFISYIYKIIQTHQIGESKRKSLLIVFIAFSLVATFLEEANSISVFGVNSRDKSTILWYSDYTESKNVLITEFGWNTALIYYSYPYEDHNRNLNPENFMYYFVLNESFSNPNKHIDENNTNILKSIKEEYETDVFLILDDYYLSPVGWEFFINMTEHQIQMYYNLSYLNRVCISVDTNGDEIPYYWVI